ncbi:MAG TPA: bifunctional phosphopantothenoylcysteine decarboxylase/phosphopantothenate--cysteine ligase CoaBC, partial [Candidatus Methanofastidiosa archaeon]|nr:bifunctional phosphopantothenoylcysteine decarboxylase/phosphopantothenate--cysteine ligase CoaBC [Candidatus Methanofastidiosa archaeon]
CSKSKTLKDKKVGLCVTGSIAAIETVKLARELRRHGADVYPLMSQAAKDIINPNSLSFATGHEVIDKITGNVEHVMLAGDRDTKLDLILVCPCTKNTLSKIAMGISDTPPTLLVATGLSHIPVMLIPTMHQTMFESELLQGHLKILKDSGVKILSEEGDEGKIKMPPVDRIVFEVQKILSEKELLGRSFLVTAGPTIERIDDVRFITNRSTGKMGIAIAEDLERRGADVKLVLGRTREKTLVSKTVRRETFQEMYDEVLGDDGHEVYVLSMAASDFTVRKEDGKISSSKGFSLELVPNKKIIADLRMKTSGIIVGFKAEHGVSDEELIDRSKRSLADNGLDMVVANDIGREKRGFEHDTNEVYIIENDSVIHLPFARKTDIAEGIVDEIVNMLGR